MSPNEATQAIVIGLVSGLVFGIIGAAVGSNRGAGFTGFIVGFLFGPIGLLIMLMIGLGKKCPFCRKKIHHQAIACPHCQRNLLPVQA